MNEKQSVDKRLWLIVSIAACTIVIVYTAWPIFHNPQLEPDDYRYLEQVRYLKQDFWGNFFKGSVIENRWDQLWWINVHEKVRFFRPTVVLSYWLDDTIYGSNNPLGLISTNILIYIACVFLVCLIFYRWIGPGISFLVSSVLFAAFFAHGEVMWYVAGRTDSLAALFLLGGLTLHIYGKQYPTLRWWAMSCFVFAILTKELTATLPFILFLSDRWIEKRSMSLRTLLIHEWKIYSVYAIIVVCFFALRARVISGSDIGYPYPYFVTLGNPNFLSHLLGQVNSYCANLLFAVDTVPFKIVTNFKYFESLRGILSGIGIFCLCSFFLLKEKKYWILVLLGLACWFPTIIVYQSERYLFLPSFAVAGSLGLLLLQLEQRNWKINYTALLICIIWIGHQAYSLQAKNRVISGNPHLAERIGKQLDHLTSSITKGSKLLLLNLPGEVLQYQFVEDQLRVQLADPDLDVAIMTPMPELFNMGAEMTITRENKNTITLQDTELLTPIMARGQDQFPWVTLDSASQYNAKSGIKIEILNGNEDICSTLRVVLPHPLSTYILLKWDPAFGVIFLSPSTAVKLTPYERKMQSTVRILTPQTY
ncbi:MAG: hypothetical protein ABR936_05975 [Bacteroidota bacterium]|jgi:hypothetical protein